MRRPEKILRCYKHRSHAFVSTQTDLGLAMWAARCAPQILLWLPSLQCTSMPVLLHPWGGQSWGQGEHDCQGLSTQVGEQLVQVVSFLPPCGFQGWNRGDKPSSKHSQVIFPPRAAQQRLFLPALPSLTLAIFSSIILPSKMFA